MIVLKFLLEDNIYYLTIMSTRLESTAEFWKIFGEKFWLKNDLQKNSESSS